jgi:hypothetical protein
VHPKLAEYGCRCPCIHIHPYDPLCTLTAAHDVLYVMFGDSITLPMCRPCADAYQRRMLAADHHPAAAESQPHV